MRRAKDTNHVERPNIGGVTKDDRHIADPPGYLGVGHRRKAGNARKRATSIRKIKGPYAYETS